MSNNLQLIDGARVLKRAKLIPSSLLDDGLNYKSGLLPSRDEVPRKASTLASGWLIIESKNSLLTSENSPPRSWLVPSHSMSFRGNFSARRQRARRGSGFSPS
jgi:hypothetical protein